MANLQPNIENERARVIQTLSDHFAYDHITLRELEQKMERAYAVRTRQELDEVLAGLPALTPTSVPAAADYAPVRTVNVPEQRTLLAFMSGIERKGVWTVAKEITAIAFMGGVDLDLREAILSPKVTTITAFAFMGGVSVLVPPGVRLECDGFGIMGGFEQTDNSTVPYDPDAPVVRLTGIAFMGGVEAKVKARKGAR